MASPTVPSSCADRHNGNEVDLEGQQQVLRATFPVSVTLLKELVGIRMDALARQFVRKHDTKVKEEIQRLAREHVKLKEPWWFVAR